MISLSSMIWVPGYAVYFLMTSDGTLAQRIQKGVTPTIKPRADALDVQSRKLSSLKRISTEETVLLKPSPSAKSSLSSSDSSDSV